MKHPDPPSKPSELIRLALRDLKAVERSKNYVINMHSWHEPDETAGVCHVCLAGAVMARSLKAERGSDLTPSEMMHAGVSPAWHARLVALDDLRNGQLACAAYIWSPCGALTGDRSIPAYHSNNNKAFHLAMEALAAEYEAVGA